MLANILIGLREGLEASLVVCILVAYVVKTDRSEKLPWIWLGIGSAVALSFGFGALLQFGSSEMSQSAQEAFGGCMSILSVGLVTWMIFWMRRSARYLKAELEGKLDAAFDVGALALTTIAFVSVGREGIETAVFVWSTTQATSGTHPFLGVLIGLGIAVALGVLIYKSAIKINLAKFFTYTGFALVFVAAGVLAYGFHDLQEAGWIPGLTNTVFDISGFIPGSTQFGDIIFTLLKGAFNFNPNPTYVEFTVWALYLVTVLTLLLRPQRAPTAVPAQGDTAKSRKLRVILVSTVAVAAIAVLATVLVTGTSTKKTVAKDVTYAVESGAKSCDLSETNFKPGPVRFTITNSGKDITEVYVYGKRDGSFSKIVNEVENIAPGATANLDVTLKPGHYQVTCKPGMVGDGIGKVISVTDAP